jgi:hypothetical protein
MTKIFSILLIAFLSVSAFGQKRHKRSKSAPKEQPPAVAPSPQNVTIVGKRITLPDGRTLEVDEVWKQGDVYWYKRGGVIQSLDDVTRTENIVVAAKPTATGSAETPKAAVPTPEKATIIYLVDGAHFKVDNVRETDTGTWYNRGSVAAFIDKERIARIEVDAPRPGGGGGRRIADWTSGNSSIDQLIRQNANQFGLDPYLVFLVIEQESHFHVRALSPKGARGLMQLMPGTARRLGVRRPFDAAENIKGGTQYLKELMDMFRGNVNLVLASYNAGEGAVLKYGRNVPPYRETRDYVNKISKRYGLAAREATENNEVPVPRR